MHSHSIYMPDSQKVCTTLSGEIVGRIRNCNSHGREAIPTEDIRDFLLIRGIIWNASSRSWYAANK
jgi:hypothetical protein